MLATLRQPRYLSLFGVCLVIALICALAGTWQIFRFEQKRSANHLLRTNYDDRTVDISQALGPVTAPTETAASTKFRHVSATGVYLSSEQTLLRGQTVDSNAGYFVMTPLKTSSGVLLVARGFIEQNNAANSSPTNIPAAPTGTVTVTGRLQPADSGSDHFGKLPGVQVDSVNAAAQSTRIGASVWDAYAELVAGQPGSAGLTPFDNPDMSNPAGGAVEPQHAAYVVQWYLFAGLALAAPFVMAAAERRRSDEDDSVRDTPVVAAAGGPDPADGADSADRADSAEAKTTGSRRQSRREKAAELDNRLAGRS